MEVLKIVPTIMSVSLLDSNVKFLNKKKKKTSDFMNQGVTNMIGGSMISETANFI